MPGTSHSQRSSLTWFSTNSGRGHGDAIPQRRRAELQVGRRAVDTADLDQSGEGIGGMPAASWRISLLVARDAAAWHIRDASATTAQLSRPLQTSAGICAS